MIPRSTDGKERVLSLSYGKDSLACLGALEELGWPLDHIAHAEVWATDTIPADLPPMVEFKAKADEIIKERWGFEVEHVWATKPGTDEKRTYEDLLHAPFVHKPQNPSHPIWGGYGRENIYGFPSKAKLWCNSRLKIAALNKAKRTISYLGIAANEPNRFHVLSDTKLSPLVAAGWDEAYCRRWCEENGLLSPIYTTAARGAAGFVITKACSSSGFCAETTPTCGR